MHYLKITWPYPWDGCLLIELLSPLRYFIYNWTTYALYIIFYIQIVYLAFLNGYFTQGTHCLPSNHTGGKMHEEVTGPRWLGRITGFAACDSKHNQNSYYPSSMKQLTARQDITRADLRQQTDEINRCNTCIDAMQDKVGVLEKKHRPCNVWWGFLKGLKAMTLSTFFSRKFCIGIRTWSPLMTTLFWS